MLAVDTVAGMFLDRVAILAALFAARGTGVALNVEVTDHEAARAHAKNRTVVPSASYTWFTEHEKFGAE